MKHQDSLAAPLLALFLSLGCPFAPLAGAQNLQEITPVPGGDWQIIWKSQAGTEYTVQRSTDLETWSDIGAVMADGPETTFIDTTTPPAPQYFWRLRYDDDGPVLLTPFSIIEVAKVDGEGNVVSPNSPDGQWRITWESQAGAIYTLQRAPDGQTWTSVATVTATSETTSYVDTEAPDLPLLLWRVLGMSGGGGTEVEISEILPQFSTSGGGNATSLGVMIDSDVPIASVEFLDGDTVLGEALPGAGGSWSFPVQWDPENPRIVQLSVLVNPVDGDPVSSDPVGLLLADPARFVPVEENGALGYGQFVPANAEGTLGAFHYYPEGAGDLREHTGAHFRIEAGAELIQQPDDSFVLQLTAAHFHRGRGDEAPLPSDSGTQQLPLNQITAATVEATFETNDEPLKLQWGGTEVCWAGGALGEDGWNSLFVEPLIGSFELPGLAVRAEIGADLENNRFYLITCFHGAWDVVNDIGLEIPEASPLKIYLATDGSISAHGTVEATFPDGAKLRGTASWREPNFEFSFEGRGFTIPALNALAPSLAGSDPPALVPAGTGQAELDTATKQLRALQRSYSKLAGASLQQASLDAEAVAVVPPTPTPEAGATLTAWTDWISVHGGTGLTPDDITKLSEVLEKSGKTAEASHSLLTALTIMRDARRIKEANIPSLDDLPATTQARAAATADRLIRSDGLPAARGSRLQVSTILLESETVAPAPAIAPRKGAAERDADVERSRAYVAKYFPQAYFDNLMVLEDGINGVNNPVLAEFNFDELVNTLEDQFDLDDHIVKSELDPDLYPTFETKTQVLVRLQINNELASNEVLMSSDIQEFKRVLDERLLILSYIAQATSQPQDFVFNPDHAPFVNAYLELFAKSISSLALEERLQRISDEVLNLLEYSKQDRTLGLEATLRNNWTNLNRLNLAVGLLGDAPICNLLAAELTTENQMPLQHPNGIEPANAISATGRYEAVGVSVFLPDLPLPLPPEQIREPHTMHLNQAGRYIAGTIYLRRYSAGILRISSTSITELRIRGLLSQIQGDALAYRIQLIHPNGVPAGTGLLTVFDGQDQPSATIDLDSSFLEKPLGSFTRVSATPVLPASVVRQFDETTQAALRGIVSSPAHSWEINTFGHYDAILSLIRNYHSEGLAQTKADIARSLESLATLLNGVLPPSTRDLVSLHLQQQLASEAILIPEIGSEQSYLNLLGRVANMHGALMPTLSQLAGLESDSLRYRYEILSANVAIGLGAFVSLGAQGFFIDIVKHDTLTNTSSPPYRFVGGALQGGLGLELPIPQIGSTISMGTLVSGADYSAKDFEGMVVIGGFSVRGIGIGGGGGAMRFIDLDETADMSGVQFQFGFDVTVGFEGALGYLWERSGVDEPFTPPNNPFAPQQTTHTSTRDARIDGQLHFKAESAQITECGYQYLREFIAEYRGLFESPTSRIEILGFADPSETENPLGLAQQRAEKVRLELIEILGPTSTQDAAELIPLSIATGIDPGTQSGRRVEILLNGSIRFNLNAAESVLGN